MFDNTRSRKRFLTLLIVMIGMILLISGTSIATAEGSYEDFYASLGPGNFALFEYGAPFSVGTWARGDADNFGKFSFSAVGEYDDTIPPPGCTPLSSYGVQGNTALVFKTGVLLLEMKNGQTCVDFPYVNVYEEYKIKGGNGIFDEAKGDVVIQFTGSLLDYSISDGTISGKIKLDD